MSNPNSKKEKNNSEIKENMQNHIFSMLKEAGIIEANDKDFYDDFKEQNLDLIDNENLNTKSSSFTKEKINIPFSINNEDINNNNIPFNRNDIRKNTFQPFFQNPLFPINNNLNVNNSLNVNFQFEKNEYQNLKNNNEEIQITTTPLGMKMPIRTFNFKTKSNSNINNYNKNIIFNIPINDPLAIKLESLLFKKGHFTLNIYNKIKGNIIYFMKNQQTSRILQYYLDKTPNDIIHLIFNEFSNQVDSLLLDPYANYFCLKIFYYLNNNDRIYFLKKISPILDILSVNKIATYPIQCIIEKLNSDEEILIVVNFLKKSLTKLSLDVYGAHVIEKLVTHFYYKSYLDDILNFITDNFLYLSCNSNGLCIIKKIILIEYKYKGERFNKIKNILYKNALELIQNPYGNYALQTVIDNWSLNDIKNIYCNFYNKSLIFSIHKVSSNVIEKCIQKSIEFTNKFIYEILSNDNSICILLKNNYGNYVLLSTLKVCEQQNKFILISLIKKYLVLINDKKLINKWRKIISSFVIN